MSASTSPTTGPKPCCTHHAKPQAEIPMMDGKDKSISPAVITKTSGMVRMIEIGKDVKIDV
jgi:hypothetical protein